MTVDVNFIVSCDTVFTPNVSVTWSVFLDS
jgi:hypothetical protein